MCIIVRGIIYHVHLNFALMKSENLQHKLGRAIRKLRKDRSISQESLSLSAGVDRRYMSDIENGKRNVSIEILERISKCLEVSVSDIIATAENIDFFFKKVEDLKEMLVNLGYEDSVVFKNPDYLDAVVGVSEEGRVIYSYERMIRCLKVTNGMDREEAAEFISYNTIGALPNAGDLGPIVMFDLFE